MLDGIANTEEKRTEYLKIAYRKSCDMDVLLSKLLFFKARDREYAVLLPRV